MKIDTNEWITMAQACTEAGFSLSTGYRLAKQLKIVEVFFGVKCVRKIHVQTMRNNRRQVGNQDWIKSPELASEAAYKSVRSRLKRIRRSGITEGEKIRNAKIAEIGRTLGGRPPRRKATQCGSR
jgi:hypothetical protein